MQYKPAFYTATQIENYIRSSRLIPTAFNPDISGRTDIGTHNHDAVNGKRAITADTALKLERYFGIEAQFWLNLQTEFDLRTMKRKIWPDIEKRIIPAKHTVESIQQNANA